MHVINGENYSEAVDAVRDILMTYVDLADAAEGFGHNADCYVRFDPLKFIDADVEDNGSYYVDLDLLRSGSAVALLCAFYNIWTEEQDLRGHPLTERFHQAVNEGRLSRFPDVETVIAEAISRNSAPIEDLWIEGATAPIYRKYVLGFFARLARQDRSAS
jgi:hypothetical protein